jgi:hypothetical protein
MSDEDDEELFYSDEELAEEEKGLFAAIRESHKLDAEIDAELEQLVDGTYDEQSLPEPGANDGGES